MEHLNIGGLVANARYEEATELLPALVLCSGTLGSFQTLRPSLSRNSRGEVSELLGLQSDELVASLRCLEGTGGRLTRRHQRRHLGTIGVEISDNTGLNLERILKCGD